MINTGKLAGRTAFVTGASRGIGKAIALKLAKDGANIVVAAKTAEPNPKLPGTIYTTCKEVENVGGKCLPCVVDIRDELQVKSAVEEAVQKFGGIDIVINNASAISLTGTLETDMKKYDLMNTVNARGTFLVSKLCLPYLKKSDHAHILNLSPPINMNPIWFTNNLAYTIAKYGMSMCVLGMHEEFRHDNIAVNALWPRTAIYTSALEMLAGQESAKYCRTPEIIADAAYVILTRDPKTTTGNFFIDDQVLHEAGVYDLKRYAVDPRYADSLTPDFFLDVTDGPKVTAPEPIEDAGKVAGLFRTIEASLSPKIVLETQAVFQFVVTGEEAGNWFIDLKNGSGSCGRGNPPLTPDVTLTMDSKNFFTMFSGKLKPSAAFMMGKLKISGNMQKALKLEKLMKSLKSKL